MVFEQPLSGLIKALRAARNDEDRVIKSALNDIRSETRSRDIEVKAAAILKGVYLEMLGYPVLMPLSFSVIELMSCPRFDIKQIGYFAATQSFSSGTEVILLTNNLIKKDLTSSSSDISSLLLTLSSLPQLLSSSPQLLVDIHPSLVQKLAHSRPNVRKMATLVLGRAWTTIPVNESSITDNEDLPLVELPDSGGQSEIDRLRERLNDDDPGVVSTTVNVLLELTRTRGPSRYLDLAPELFQLLTGQTRVGSNNWMLIKIIKIFALFTPIEPRLVKKLLPPLSNLIQTTSAMSLLYECIDAVIGGGMLVDGAGLGGEQLAALCVDKLSAFLSDDDQNLRYIALVSLCKTVPSHPHLVSRYHETILDLVEDSDISIRSRALDLVQVMVDRDNLINIVSHLTKHLAPIDPSQATSSRHGPSAAESALRSVQSSNLNSNSNIQSPSIDHIHSPEYKTQMIHLVLSICSNNIYAKVTDFEWFIDLLLSMSYVSLDSSALFLGMDENDNPVTEVVDLNYTEKLDASRKETDGTIVWNTESNETKSDTNDFSVSPAKAIADCLIDVCGRVQAIRPLAVSKISGILENESFFEGSGSEILTAAAWIVGEYAGIDGEEHDLERLIRAFFTPRLPQFAATVPNVTSFFIHNGIKLFSRWASSEFVENPSEKEDFLSKAINLARIIQSRIHSLSVSSIDDVELIERIYEFSKIMEIVVNDFNQELLQCGNMEKPVPQYTYPGDDGGFAEMDHVTTDKESTRTIPRCLLMLDVLFSSHKLNPVNSVAQSMVPLPEGLDLEQPIVISSMESNNTIEGTNEWSSFLKIGKGSQQYPPGAELDGYGRIVGAAPYSYAEENDNNIMPPIIKATRGKSTKESKKKKKTNTEGEGNVGKKKSKKKSKKADDIDDIPIVQLNINDLGPSNKVILEPPKPKSQKHFVVDVEGELPPGATRPNSSSSLNALNSRLKQTTSSPHGLSPSGPVQSVNTLPLSQPSTASAYDPVQSTSGTLVEHEPEPVRVKVVKKKKNKKP